LILLAPVLALLAAGPGGGGVIVVVPPEGPLGGETAWVAEAVADELPRALLLVDVPAVERHDRLRVQERLGLPAVRLTRATSIRVAEALGAWRMVVGTWEVSGSAITIAVRLLDLDRGALSAPLMASGPLETVPGLVAGLASDIALLGPTRPSRSREDLMSLRGAIPFEAWKAHAQALGASEASARAKLLRRALALSPGYDEARLDLARQQLDAREYAQALETLGRIGSASLVSRPARFAEGVVLSNLGRYAEAAALDASLAQSEASPALLSNQALAAMRGGTLGSRPSTLLQRAVDRERASYDLPVNLGFALLQEGDPAAAAFWLRIAVKRDARDGAARLLLSWALRQAGLEAEAEEEWSALSALTTSFASLRAPDFSRRFERVLPSERALLLNADVRADAEPASAHLSRGEQKLQGGDVAEASAELAQAVLLDPLDARSRALLAKALRSRGEVAKAESELRGSLYCREDSTVRLELADLLLAMGRGDEARKEARRVLETEPDQAAARLILEGH
jgi:Tfp pilus assembly protein PilF